LREKGLLLNILEEIKEENKLTCEFYDVIRVVNPKGKTVVFKDNIEKKEECICYEFWGKDNPCRNCISIRALLENETFTKIEQINGKIYLATSTPVEFNGCLYIFEMIKDITSKKVKDLCDSEVKEDINKIIIKVNELQVNESK